MVHCLAVPPATQVCGGHSKGLVLITQKCGALAQVFYNATGNVSRKESRHVPSRKLSEFEELFFRLCSIVPVSICRFCTKCRVGCLK